MKYFAIIILIALIVGSWFLVKLTPTIPAKTENLVASEVQSLIERTLISKNANLKELKFEEISARETNPGEMTVKFTYTFLNAFDEKSDSKENTIEQVSGETILVRVSDPQEIPSHWKLKEVRTSNNSIVFTEGIIITPGPATD